VITSPRLLASLLLAFRGLCAARRGSRRGSFSGIEKERRKRMRMRGLIPGLQEGLNRRGREGVERCGLRGRENIKYHILTTLYIFELSWSIDQDDLA
jgi:hypothetical protein